MKLTKNTIACAFAFAVLPVMSHAYADDAAPTSVEIQFNGSVKAPTCSINNGTNPTVTLPEIDLAKLADLSTGQAASFGQKRFQIMVDCAEQANKDNITLTIDGPADASTPTILKNTSTDADSAQGVGFEIFSTVGDTATPLTVSNGVVPSADYISRLNKGADNIEFSVQYAKEEANVTAGNVNSSATFAFTYK